MATKMLARDLVLDFEIYPRQEVNGTNVADLVAAMEAGIKLPPAIVDRKTLRVVDGWHRVKAALRIDPEGEIAVTLKDYPSEAALFEDAIHLNAIHGQKLSHFDQARCMARAVELKMAPAQIAAAFGITIDRLSDLQLHKTATVGKTMVPIKHTAAHLAGQQITKAQAAAAAAAGGMSATFYVNQVIKIIEGDILEVDNEKLMERLRHLARLLESVIAVTA
jgi:hypothetical protein